jgi:molybdate transport system substrate-binding protein
VTLTRLLRRAALALCLAAAPAAAEERITVFAAASLKTALDAVAEEWRAATGHEARLAYAGSSALARQIQSGAPADVFVSANEAWMDALAADGLIDPDSRVALLGNALVLVAHDPEAAPVALRPGTDLPARLGEGRLAMALVEAVPAGIYGKAALETLGLWEAVAPSVAQADNVRAALALVATGAAPYGIVYATDAVAEDRVRVVGRFPPGTHPPIVYPAAVTARAEGAAPAAFLAFLQGPEARAAFERNGFALLADD